MSATTYDWLLLPDACCLLNTINALSKAFWAEL